MNVKRLIEELQAALDGAGPTDEETLVVLYNKEGQQTHVVAVMPAGTYKPDKVVLATWTPK